MSGPPVRLDSPDFLAPFDRRRTIHARFADRARAGGGGPALLCGEAVVSYADLDRRSNRFARFVASKGVRPGGIVGLFLPRSPDAIVAMLGILKAGAAFLPLDPSYPFDQLAFIAADAAPVAVVSTSALAPTLRPAAVAAEHPWTAPTLVLEEAAPAIALQSEAPLEESVTGDDLAYVMYTSGTTGRPKGVMVPHRGVSRLARGRFVELGQDDVVLQLAPLAFDASTFEIWSALLNGAAVAIVAAPQPSFDEIGAAIRRHGVTTAWLTASLFHAIVDRRIEILSPLRQLIAGGDVLSPRHVRRALDALPACRLVNGYGPTENTTFTCCHEINSDADPAAAVPIGRPIEHTRVYVLDPALRPVADGEEGELFAAGDGVALGYLKRPELTREKFLPDPFSGSDEMMYRSGDLVRRRTDGNIDFVGRVDRQVKISGKRVELDDVEALLRRLPGVADAATTVRERAGVGRQIIGYIAAQIPIDPASLRKSMLEIAPDHLTPAQFVILPDLPRTQNGKVDRAALPDPAAPMNPAGPGAANDIESRLAMIWSHLLRAETIGLDANFFDLGGASLDVMAMHQEIKARFGRDLPMTALFEFTTIRSLAAHLQGLSESAAGEPPIPAADIARFNNRRMVQAEAQRRAARRRIASE